MSKVIHVNRFSIFVLYCTVFINTSVMSQNVTTNNSTTTNNSSRIPSHDKETALGDVPYHVLMFKKNDPKLDDYRAFCAGSIISENRVLSSSNCYLTNRKRLRVPLEDIDVVAAILITYFVEPSNSMNQQWRIIVKIYSQSFYRFPVYDLAILEMNKPWDFNNYVNRIPYATLDQSFDGVCMTVTVKPKESWATVKSLYNEEVQIMIRRQCEHTLFRSCRLFLCTKYLRSREIFTQTEGGGIICHGTGDPAEIDNKGLLVGVTSLINIGLPSLHMRVGPFHKWISDTTCRVLGDYYFIFTLLLLNKLL